MKQTAKVFLCYAKEDKPRVEQLYNKLKDAGFAPWMDKVDLAGGEEWQPAIQKAIRESHFFIACISKHWIPTNPQDRKRFFRREIQTALDVLPELAQGDIFVIPIRLEECEVPDNLSLFQWIDYFQKGGWDPLIQSINKGMDRLGFIKPVRLRSLPINAFSVDDLAKMLREWDFFDSTQNRLGKGVLHQYERVKRNAGIMVIDHTTNLRWQQSGSKERTFAKAGKYSKYISALNRKQFAGFDDWRLPTLEEAMSLIEPKRKNGDLFIDPLFDRQQSTIWTADKVHGRFAWYVDFNTGSCFSNDVFYGPYVRAVRSGQ